MSIVKAKKKSADAFIAAAPDADSKSKGVKKGNKVQISLTLDPETLNKVDELAAKIGQSRAGFINLAIYQAVTQGLLKS